jgi:hypothetical protein
MKKRMEKSGERKEEEMRVERIREKRSEPSQPTFKSINHAEPTFFPLLAAKV